MSQLSTHTAPPPRRPILPNAVLGVLIIVMSEAMFFAGMISAFVIARAGTPTGMWPPPDQPRLPVEATAVNTAILVFSGIALIVANRYFGRSDRSAKVPMLLAVLGGALFLTGQGYEWVQLIAEGLTMKSSNHGAFFYFTVGAHALHVAFGVTVLAGLFVRLLTGRLTYEVLWAGSIFWYFVVSVWPIIYWQVYL